MTDKVNIEETNTVWSQSLRRAEGCIAKEDVTLSTSYNKCQECTTGWTPPMNKCRATDLRMYAFPDPCVIVFFFHVVISLPPLTILLTLVFSHYEQVYRIQKVCISWPMFITFFFLVLVGTTTSRNIRHFFNTLYNLFLLQNIIFFYLLRTNFNYKVNINKSIAMVQFEGKNI